MTDSTQTAEETYKWGIYEILLWPIGPDWANI